MELLVTPQSQMYIEIELPKYQNFLKIHFVHNVLFQDIHAVRGNIDGKLAIKRMMESDDTGKVCLFV